MIRLWDCEKVWFNDRKRWELPFHAPVSGSIDESVAQQRVGTSTSHILGFRKLHLARLSATTRIAKNEQLMTNFTLKGGTKQSPPIRPINSGKLPITNLQRRNSVSSTLHAGIKKEALFRSSLLVKKVKMVKVRRWKLPLWGDEMINIARRWSAIEGMSGAVFSHGGAAELAGVRTS